MKRAGGFDRVDRQDRTVASYQARRSRCKNQKFCIRLRCAGICICRLLTLRIGEASRIGIMIASLLLAALTVSVAPTDNGSETVQNRSFYAIGWPCDGEGCQSNPRKLDPNLRFKLPASQAGFDRAKKLDQTWSVTLDCAIVSDRLAKCGVADDTVGSVEARSIALGLANFFRVQPENTGKKIEQVACHR